MRRRRSLDDGMVRDGVMHGMVRMLAVDMVHHVMVALDMVLMVDPRMLGPGAVIAIPVTLAVTWPVTRVIAAAPGRAVAMARRRRIFAIAVIIRARWAIGAAAQKGGREEYGAERRDGGRTQHDKPLPIG
jgi:hypothetical protein